MIIDFDAVSALDDMDVLRAEVNGWGEMPYSLR
jgi:hypothetical protein